MWATNNKLARGVHIELDVAFVEKGFDFGGVDTFVNHTWYDDVFNVLLYALQHLAVGLLL